MTQYQHRTYKIPCHQVSIMKRIGIFGDLHTGHRTGLCHPDWWGGNPKVKKELERVWTWFVESLKKAGRLECVVLNGDFVDGPGVKNGQECIISDLNEQQMCAAEIIKTIIQMTKNPVVYMTYGTPAHVTIRQGYELEKGVAAILDVIMKRQLWIDVDEFTLDIRHHPAGNSTVFPGNPLQKEHEANLKWAREGVQPEAQFIIRSHTHKMYTVSEPNRWMGIACPSLQGMTSYGSRLSNVVHCGWGILDFSKKGEWPIWKVTELPRKKERVFSL